MKLLLLSLALIPSLASAAHLEDVRLLSVQPGPEKFELKLQVKDGSPDSYFYLDVVKGDPDALGKLAHVFKKMIRKKGYRLDLNIPSFSASPSGSYYRSEGVTFSAPLEREPNDSNTGRKTKTKTP